MAELTVTRLHELLDYDPETGVFTWRVTRGEGVAGKVAGSINKMLNYIMIGVDRHTYYAHRLAWLYIHGQWPTDRIDHHDLNQINNKISNLRAANQSQNTANTSRSRRNTSGFKGVSWDARGRVWVAQISCNKKHVYIGSFATPEEAHAAYIVEAHKHFGEFARGD